MRSAGSSRRHAGLWPGGCTSGLVEPPLGLAKVPEASAAADDLDCFAGHLGRLGRLGGPQSGVGKVNGVVEMRLTKGNMGGEGVDPSGKAGICHRPGEFSGVEDMF